MAQCLKVLIIGGNRFVGKRLAQQLLKDSHQVTLLNRGNIDDGFENKVVRICCDRYDTTAMSKAVEGQQWDAIYDQLCFDARQAQQVCEIFKDKTKQYIFSSSQVVYGLGSNCSEEDFDPKTHKILGLSSDYIQGKQQAEAYLYAHSPWPVIAARLPIIFGPDDRRLNFHIARMLNDLEIHFPKLQASISLIDADDAAQCLAFFLGKPLNEPINCTPRESITLARFKEIIERVLNKPLKLAKIPAVSNTSPYALLDNWTLSGEKLFALGHQVPAIEDKLPIAISRTNISQAMDTLVDKPNPPIGFTLTRPSVLGKKILITGSSSGFGQALAFSLAQAGAKLVIHSHEQNALNETLAAIEGAGFDAVGIMADLSTQQGCQRLVEESLSKRGGLDVLINNAAVATEKNTPLWEKTPQEWERIIHTNLSGPYYCSNYFTQYLVSKPYLIGDFRIINVLDSGANRPSFQIALYQISKQALNNLTKTLAAQITHRKIAVLGIERGYSQTPLAKRLISNESFYNQLPLPDCHLPIFNHALTAPIVEIHGKILSSPNFSHDQDASLRMNPNWVFNRPFRLMNRYNPKGQEINRESSNVLMYDRGETPLGTSPKAIQAIQSIAEMDLSRYPARCDYFALRKALGKHLKLPPECFSLGPGSNELIERILRCFTQMGSLVISNDPTYLMFNHVCEGLKLTKIQVPFSNTKGTLDHNLEAIANKVTPQTQLIYLISPGNPIGVSIDKQSFRRFLVKIPKHIPIVVDEAYVDYSSNPNILQVHKLIPTSEHCLIGIRTFSKAYGLAGLRVGFAYAKPDTIHLLERLEPLVSISSIAEKAAIAAIEDEAHIERVKKTLNEDRLEVEKELTALQIKFISVETPYMPISLPFCSSKLVKRLEEFNIFIAPFKFLDNYIRIPIGNRAVSQKILSAIRALQNE